MWKTHTLYDYWQLICSRSWLPGALRRSRNSGDPRLTSLCLLWRVQQHHARQRLR